MSVTRIDPNDELYWKKELTSLRKHARFLRDPETSSSWRSPLSSRSLAAAASLNYLNAKDGNSTRANRIELDLPSPLNSATTQKKVFLYNWRTHSNKSSDSGGKVDKYGREKSVPESPGYSLSEGSPKLQDTTNLHTTVRKTVKKSKKNLAVSRHCVVKRSAISRRLSLPSIEQSDDTEYCNSEDLHLLRNELIRKNGCPSRSAPPFLFKSENRAHVSKHLKKVQKEDSSVSCTPASTNSYNIYGCKNPSTLGSYDGTSASYDDEDEEEDKNLDLPGSQGCGIPCYWSRRSTPKLGSIYSPSFSDTLRRKGNSIFCGNQAIHHKRTRKNMLESGQGLPLLTNSWKGRNGTSIDTEESDNDELSSKFEELDLEGMSRLDGRRWSLGLQSRSQEGLELVAVDEGSTPDHIRTLSQKYKPSVFDEIIGQNIVVQSLINAIARGKVAPIYLFQGPRGTGKTSVARIFAAALNCTSTNVTKPCGSCRECTTFFCGKDKDLEEVDGTDTYSVDMIIHKIKKMSAVSSLTRYRVFIIDECHLLTSKMWSAFLKTLVDLPAQIVFIFITTDLDNLPRTVLSRCQKYLFNKIKDADMISRLKKLSTKENLDIEPEALHLIALNAEGSLRDAETLLDQLSLLGNKITASLVNELVGVVSDEKLLDLLELALSSDTSEMIKKSKDLIDSGVEPIALMSQLAGLIMDIIAGTDQLVDSKCSGSYFGSRSLSDEELKRLKKALKVLSDAEKQLKISDEHSIWLTAALLQLGSVSTSLPTSSSGGRNHCSKTISENLSGSSIEVSSRTKKPGPHNSSRKSTSSTTIIPREVDGHSSPCRLPSSRNHEGTASGDRSLRCTSPDKLDDIWERSINGCQSKTLRQLMQAHGKLLSISEIEGNLIAFVVFENPDIKSAAEMFISSITNAIETVLRHKVEIRIGTARDGSLNNRISKELTQEREMKFSRELLEEADLLKDETNEEIPMQRIQAIIEEQRMESAWLQAADKGNFSIVNRSNQVMPQDGIYGPDQMGSLITASDLSSVNHANGHEIKVAFGDANGLQKDQFGTPTLNRYHPMSPSLLHNRNNFKQEYQGYESGTGGCGCSGLLCWKKTNKRHSKVKAKQQSLTGRGYKTSFNQHGKSRRSESRFKI